MLRVNDVYKDNALRSKVEAENIIAHALIQNKCCLRISAPMAGQSLRTVIKIFIEAALKARPLYYYGTGARTQDFIYIDDIAAAFVAAFESHADRVHYLRNVAINEGAGCVGDRLNYGQYIRHSSLRQA